MAKKLSDPATGLLEAAASEVESLKEEMTEWQGNMEGNNMEHLPKYEQVTECVDALEQSELLERVEELLELISQAAEEPKGEELPAIDLEVTVEYVQSTAKRQSRADRLGQATEWLELGIGAIENKLAVLKEADAVRVKEAEEEWKALGDDAEGEPPEADERFEELEQALQQLRDAQDTLSDVSFPGMYG